MGTRRTRLQTRLALLVASLFLGVRLLVQWGKVEGDGPWQPVPMNRGVWIRGDAIRTIEPHLQPGPEPPDPLGGGAAIAQ